MSGLNTFLAGKNVSSLRFGAAAPGVVHQPIALDNQGRHVVPDRVRIPVIEGDGIGPEIMRAAQQVVDEAVERAYSGQRSIEWVPMIAGEKALAQGKGPVPEETLDTIKQHFVFVKGPLNTPLGGGMRSVNVWLRNFFDLFACIRPVKNIPGIVTPMKQDRTDVVLFRENTEDVYSGIEFAKGSPEAQAMIEFLRERFQITLPPDTALGVKPISEKASKRIIEQAIRYALEHGRPSVTMVHKGNIMKYTEGAFAQWGKELAREKFPDQVILYDDFAKQYGADYNRLPKGKVVLQERLTDAKFQDAVLNPHWDSVLVTMNLNGDYLSDAYAATIGGLGVAPGANVGDRYAMFESTHGTAPNIAGRNIANPTALLLTMQMMLDHLQWDEAAQLLGQAVEETLRDRKMTGDLAQAIPGTPALTTTQYADAVIDTMKRLGPARELGVA
jgi:isocitrate dehydrogenase